MDENEVRLCWHKDVTRFSDMGPHRFGDVSDIFHRAVFDPRVHRSERVGRCGDHSGPSSS